jgi:hypothetical protein
LELQPLPLKPDHVSRVSFNEFLGKEGGGSSDSESGLFKILNAVAMEGSLAAR